jgi:hypothetical protein
MESAMTLRTVCQVAWCLVATLAVGCQKGAEYEPYRASGTTRSMKLGGAELIVEVAASSMAREKGLMFRQHLPENHGMIFMYSQDQVMHFWMKNTQIPLSIAFFGTDGVITNIEDMQPLSERPGTTSTGPVRYALETNQGWFAKHGIKAGDKIELPDWFKEFNPQADP